MMMFRSLVLFVLLIAGSCNPKKSSNTPRAFYFWQTSLSSFDWRDSLFESTHARKIYCRFFDIDWNEAANAPVPVSPLDTYYYYDGWKGTDVVPVVFITNETFKHLNKQECEDLAQHVHRKIMAKLNTVLVSEYVYDLYDDDQWMSPNPYQVKSKKFNEQEKYDSLYKAKMKTIREIQFDCDWTKSTKDKYFAFLEASKKLFNDKLVSSTVRLYQYKYPKEAGLPPVSRGMLMCYNAGNVKDVKSKNSIFDKDEIMSYLEGSEYPIPLDYALPIFGWALWYRDGELKGILSTDEILNGYYAQYLRVVDEHHYTVTSEFVNGYTDRSYLLRKGDEIRIEEPSMEAVESIAAWLGDHKNNKEAILSLYHLNNYDFKKYHKEIETIFNSF